MTIRFRKSIKLAPGIRWNLSGSGSSFTFGPRGMSVSTGSGGTHINAGIPGTGLSSRTRIDGPTRAVASERSDGASVKMTCSVDDDGTLRFADAAGNAMPERLVNIAKKQNRAALTGLIERVCDGINDQVEALGRIHHNAPDPRLLPRFVGDRFAEAEPVRTPERTLGFFARMFASKREEVERFNRTARDRYEREVAARARREADHASEQERRRHFIESLIRSDPASMETFLEERMQGIEWPRETQVAFEVRNVGRTVAFDVDLPEIEEMPKRIAAVPTRGLRLSVKELSAPKVQKLYLTHAHGILFRLIGEAFAALPAVDQVLASGYSQRADPASGRINDEYLLSIRVDRAKWRLLDFANLQAVDVVEALGALGVVRNVQRTGKLVAVQPLLDAPRPS